MNDISKTGIDLSLECAQEDGKRSLETSGRFTYNNITAQVKGVNHNNLRLPYKFTGDIVVQHPMNFFWGLRGSYEIQENQMGLTSWKGLCAFSQSFVTLVTWLEKLPKETYYKIGFDWFHNLTRSLSIAMLIHFVTWGPVLGLGIQYTINSHT